MPELGFEHTTSWAPWNTLTTEPPQQQAYADSTNAEFTPLNGGMVAVRAVEAAQQLRLCVTGEMVVCSNPNTTHNYLEYDSSA